MIQVNEQEGLISLLLSALWNRVKHEDYELAWKTLQWRSFTTRELLSKTPYRSSGLSKALNRLEEKGLVRRRKRGNYESRYETLLEEALNITRSAKE